MTKEIDPSQAASWDDEEYEYNLAYLRDRGRTAEALECVRVREEGAKPSKKAKSDE